MNPNELADLLHEHITISGDGNVVGKNNSVTIIKQAAGDYAIQIGVVKVDLSLNELRRIMAQPRLPQLPERADYFTDRETALEKLMADLQPGKVVTLCGPGGIGKTALAAEAVWKMPPKIFPDGVFFHSFYNQPEATLALEEIARGFGEDASQGTPATAAKRALAGRQALLFLDGAENADKLSDVLAVRGKCGVLITSRRRKDARTNRQDVSSLEQDDAVSLLQAWGGERAADESATSQICKLVGGLPLAVRLVGRYLDAGQEDAEDYLEWLSETPLDALDQGKRQLDSVLLLLNKSLEQVSPAAQQVLGVVGMLALAWFDREVVADALNMQKPKVGPLLGELVNYGLLVRPKKRYQVSHPLVHTYASERLTVNDDIAERLGAYYKILVEEKSQLGVWTELDSQRPHIMDVLDKLVELKRWEAAKKLARILSKEEGYLNIRGYWTQRITASKMGVKAAEALAHQRDQGVFLGQLGRAYFSLGQVDLAKNVYEEGQAIARKIGNRQDEAAHLSGLGTVYHTLGKIEQSIKFWEDAWVILREINNPQNESYILGNLGRAHFSIGQVPKAIDFHEQGLAISRQIGDRRGEANRLQHLGVCYCVKGQVEQGLDFFQQALVISGEIGERTREGTLRSNLGNTYRILGQMEEAIDYYEQALGIAREIGNRSSEGGNLGNLGITYRALGEVRRAIGHYQQALAIAREIGNRHLERNQLINLGNAHHQLGQAKQAIKFHQQALAISREMKDQRGEALVSWNLGEVYEESDPARAVELMSLLVAYEREIGHPDADAHAERVSQIQARLRSSE